MTQILKMAAQTEIEKICMIEAVICYVDPKSVGPLNFLGKERIRFPVTKEHFLLTVFKKKFAEFVGLKADWPRNMALVHVSVASVCNLQYAAFLLPF